jgi:outer membrane protein OmpA-like peptidoglycan-associated protein
MALLMACACLAGCASKGSIVLLPSADGRPAAVSVKQGEKEVVLDQPYAAADTRTLGQVLGPRAYRSDAQSVQSSFGPALAAQPRRPTIFTLYFVEGRDEFTEESKQLVDKVLRDIAQRPLPDVLVVGHTDLVGSDPSNDALGLQRAETVRAALIRLDIRPENIRAISRGKRAPAVPTADGVAEPRNRRVEIVVR